MVNVSKTSIESSPRFLKKSNIKNYLKMSGDVIVRKGLALEIARKKTTELLWLQNIPLTHVLVLFEAISSKQFLTVGTLTIMM